jgi:hypothetical protein
MPEEVYYDADNMLMRIKVWGDDPIDDWIASRKQVVQLYEKHGAVMLLVDVRDQESAPGIMDVFDFGEDWPQEIRLAILIGENTPDDVQFLESVAVNHGKNIRIFYEEAECLRWLKESPDILPL